MAVRPTKTQISLGIRPIWSESSLCAQWIAKDTKFLHADSEDSDQTGRMPKLIWVFAGRTFILLVLSCCRSNVMLIFIKHWAVSWENVSLFVCLCWGLTSQSTIFQSCRDGATASWVIYQYFRGVKCLAQGHNTAAVGFEPPTSRSGVRHSTTEPPRSPEKTCHATVNNKGADQPAHPCSTFAVHSLASKIPAMYQMSMDGWVRVLRPFNSISVILRWWKGEH